MKRLLPLLMFLLVSCSLTSPRDVGNEYRVMLEPLTGTASCALHLRGGVKVNYPAIPEDLDTYRIAILDRDARRDYLAHMRWSEFLASLVQSTLVRSLNAGSVFNTAVSDERITDTRWELSPEIQKFELVYSAGSMPKVVIQLKVLLRKEGEFSVKKEFTLTDSLDVQSDSAASIITGFRQDFLMLQEKLLQKLSNCRLD